MLHWSRTSFVPRSDWAVQNFVMTIPRSRLADQIEAYLTRCRVCEWVKMHDCLALMALSRLIGAEFACRLPAQAVPIVDFLAAKDFDLAAWCVPFKPL